MRARLLLEVYEAVETDAHRLLQLFGYGKACQQTTIVCSATENGDLSFHCLFLLFL